MSIYIYDDGFDDGAYGDLLDKARQNRLLSDVIIINNQEIYKKGGGWGIIEYYWPTGENKGVKINYNVFEATPTSEEFNDLISRYLEIHPSAL